MTSHNKQPRPPGVAPSAGGASSAGQASGRAPVRPSPARPTASVCECDHLDVVHNLAGDNRTRTACSVHTGTECTPCDCRRFEPTEQDPTP